MVADGSPSPELVGANLVAGVAILALALLGAGERVMRLVPLPIVVGMFAGSVLEYVTGAVAATAEDAPWAGRPRRLPASRARSARAGHPPSALARRGRRSRRPDLAGRLGPVDGALAPARPRACPGIALSPEAIAHA